MQLGIVGWPKVGKTLLFNILTAARQETIDLLRKLGARE